MSEKEVLRFGVLMDAQAGRLRIGDKGDPKYTKLCRFNAQRNLQYIRMNGRRRRSQRRGRDWRGRRCCGARE